MNRKNNTGGRPTKFKPEYSAQAYELTLLGFTDKQLADHFDVNEDTINEWKKAHPKFKDALNRGKSIADGKVVASLFKRAIGFKYDEVTWERIDGQVVIQATSAGDIKSEPAYKKKVVTKMVVPDVAAQKMWLNNRQPEFWREREIDFSKMTDEQLDKIIEGLQKKSQ